MFYLTMLAIC